MIGIKNEPIKDQLGIIWSDSLWLRSNNLTEENVLKYFSLSKFYNEHCINKLAGEQNLPEEEQKYF